MEVTIPLHLRFSAVDKWHPQRLAVVRGPVVLVQEGNAHEPVFKLPETDEDLNKWLVPDTGAAEQPGYFRMQPPDGHERQRAISPVLRRDRIAGVSDVFRQRQTAVSVVVKRTEGHKVLRPQKGTNMHENGNDLISQWHRELAVGSLQNCSVKSAGHQKKFLCPSCLFVALSTNPLYE